MAVWAASLSTWSYVGCLTAPPPVIAAPALHAALPMATSCWPTTTLITISPHPTAPLGPWQSQHANTPTVTLSTATATNMAGRQNGAAVGLSSPDPCPAWHMPGPEVGYVIPPGRRSLCSPRPVGLAPLSHILPAGSRRCLPGRGHPLPHSGPPRPGVMTWVTWALQNQLRDDC